MGNETNPGEGYPPGTRDLRSYYERLSDLLSLIKADHEMPVKRALFRFPVLEPGDILRLTDEPVDAVYVVEQGVVRRVIHTAGRGTCTYGLCLPGAVSGLFATAGADWGDAFIACAPSSLWRIQSHALPLGSQRELASLCSLHLQDEYEFQRSLLARDAEQKLAMFLLRLSAQLDRLAFDLPMADTDVADYLGCAVAAIRSGLHLFAARGWIRQNGREMELLEPQALRRLGAC